MVKKRPRLALTLATAVAVALLAESADSRLRNLRGSGRDGTSEFEQEDAGKVSPDRMGEWDLLREDPGRKPPAKVSGGEMREMVNFMKEMVERERESIAAGKTSMMKVLHEMMAQRPGGGGDSGGSGIKDELEVNNNDEDGIVQMDRYA